MRCHHFDAGTCRSCTLLDVPRHQQIEDAGRAVETLLHPFLRPGVDPDAVWGAPIISREAGFRTRAKMVVSGTAAAPVLGLAPGAGGPAADPHAGVDLTDCPLHQDGIQGVLEGVRALIRRAQVPPYDVARRRGELKNVLVTASPDGEHLVRLVLRSDRALDRIREHLPALLEDLPSIRIVSANLHPEHKAVLEGEVEIPLVGPEALPIRLQDLTLFARPQSFTQTNTEVAAALYQQVGAWVSELATARGTADPLVIWDLYCGIGGFALHCVGPGRRVVGVEISAPAIASACASRDLLRVQHPDLAAEFHVADATDWATTRLTEPRHPEAGPSDAAHPHAEHPDAGPAPADNPDVVIVNPPRRGIGQRLAGLLEEHGPHDVLYSSCNPATLGADLGAMPAYRIIRAHLVDMFPHTRHDEVLVHLRRT
ncbi:MAG: methyltransferase domain-containing protein [Brachybacterium sp.]|nr:methyltransferase domain-containing protein [Brachybacterium sp.]